jgi:diguanylate cyclase (GGDEF)-like protein
VGDPRTAAYVQAYALWEAVQGEGHEQAAAQLPELLAQAERAGWGEVAFVAAAAQTVYGVVRPTPETRTAAENNALLERAELLQAPAFVAVALALRAVAAAGRGDTEVVLADAGRAVALLDAGDLPALDRCTAYVVCAAAYNALSLWELGDELYGRAVALEPECLVTAQAPAIATNLVLIRLEWGTSLLEIGEQEQAREQLERALQAVRDAEGTVLPELWRRDLDACQGALRLLLGEGDVEALLASTERQRAGLAAAGDLEVLALLDACRALVLLRRGSVDQARAALRAGTPTSSSTGARSFPAWVRARVAAAADPGEGVDAAGEYGLLVSRLRWQSRAAVLVSARSFIAMERLQVEHRRLTRDVYTDPLTGLQNRRAFDAWLSRPSGRTNGAALLLLDLDSFKRVNDTMGHGTGDAVLRAVGAIVADHVRPGDLALRQGGDEFAVVLDQVVALDATAAVSRAAELRAAIGAFPWEQLAPGLSVDVSIGVALGPHGAPTELYRLADEALYLAKGHVRGVVLLEVAPADVG